MGAVAVAARGGEGREEDRGKRGKETAQSRG